MKKNYDELALNIVEHVGGDENIESLYNCATRLRFQLKDNNKAKTEILENLDGVLKVVQSAGQYQVVIGSDVAEVYKAIVNKNGLETNEEDKQESKGKLSNRIFGIISGIFAPYLPAIAASGILKGLLALFTSVGWLTPESGTYAVLAAISNALFYFFPIFLAFTAAKQFGANPYVAAVIGGALLEPNFTALMSNDATETSFIGIPTVLMNYASSVIPVILAVWLYSYLEGFLNRILHKDIRMILTPLVALVITVPLTIMIFGPISGYLTDALGAAMTFLGEKNGIITGIIAGGLLSFLPLFGLQWGIIPILLLNHSTYGFDTFNPMWVMGTYAQMGVALGIFIKAKERNQKSFALSTFFTGIVAGVTEPILYGIVTKYKRTFLPIIIGGAIGGALIGALQVKQYAFAFAGVLAFPTFFGTTFWWYVLGVLVSIMISALIVIFFGFEDKAETKKTPNEPSNEGVKIKEYQEKKDTSEDVYSPLSGEVVKLEDMNDGVFSSKDMGDGIAIIPSEYKVYAPIQGRITNFLSSKHAIGITSDNGAELLIHVGIDTVKLKGKYFTAKAKKGDYVEVGDLLLEFDGVKIKEEGFELFTPLIVTNTSNYSAIQISVDKKTITNGERLLTLLP
ncbi:beta-glucoside-specific PTS transporter subunit IIABC [Paenibacillus polymyxa]|nr:beta-glucoside-specific PTS transporter subunit IIABC [Paenibacillus polymyxa]WDZ59157.1 beta-glucoside-specific PTS transporter subunit IIABC [Paenibacillus polymyxa]